MSSPAEPDLLKSPPGSARAQSAYNRAAFDGKSVDEVIKALGVAKPVASPDIAFTAPDIAENGAVVPIGASTTVAGVRRIAFREFEQCLTRCAFAPKFKAAAPSCAC